MPRYCILHESALTKFCCGRSSLRGCAELWTAIVGTCQLEENVEHAKKTACLHDHHDWAIARLLVDLTTGTRFCAYARKLPYPNVCATNQLFAAELKVQ